MSQRRRDIGIGACLIGVGLFESVLLGLYLTRANRAPGKDYVPLILATVGLVGWLIGGVLLSRAIRNASPAPRPTDPNADQSKDLPLVIGFVLAIVAVNVWAILNL